MIRNWYLPYKSQPTYNIQLSCLYHKLVVSDQKEKVSNLPPAIAPRFATTCVTVFAFGEKLY